MKTIRFVRHSEPASPFNDYSKLTLQELDDLSTGKFSPDISDNADILLQKTTYFKELNKVDLILSSDVKRAVQTAQVIQKYTNKAEIMVSEHVSEIHFSPIKFTNINSEENPLSFVRKNIFKQVAKGEGAESYLNVEKRVQQTFELIHGLDKYYILVVTHGMYISLLKLFIDSNNKLTKDNVEDLEIEKGYPYLEGIEIQL